MGTANGDFKIGATLCWLSSVTLPLGLLAIGGGPCAGPRNATGSAILLLVGVAAIVGPVYGFVRVIQLFRTLISLGKLSESFRSCMPLQSHSLDQSSFLSECFRYAPSCIEGSVVGDSECYRRDVTPASRLTSCVVCATCIQP